MRRYDEVRLWAIDHGCPADPPDAEIAAEMAKIIANAAEVDFDATP